MVYSIDSAELSQSVLELKNVIHIKSVAEKATIKLKEQIAKRCDMGSGFSLNEEEIQCADLLVSDMNVTPFDLIQYLEVYLPFLKKGGRLIATLKFFGTGSDRVRQLELLREKLESQFWKEIRFFWLLANTKSERMVTAVMKETPKETNVL